MHIKEFPEIRKDGEVVATKTSTHGLISEFTRQMQDRGLTAFAYFTDEEAQKEFFETKKDQEDYDQTPHDEFPSGISWTEDFTANDMITLFVSYMNNTMSQKEKLNIVTQLQNSIMTEFITDDENEYPEDEDEF